MFTRVDDHPHLHSRSAALRICSPIISPTDHFEPLCSNVRGNAYAYLSWLQSRWGCTVAVEVGERFGVVADHGVEVEGLRVGKVGVGDGNRHGGPVGGEP